MEEEEEFITVLEGRDSGSNHHVAAWLAVGSIAQLFESNYCFEEIFFMSLQTQNHERGCDESSVKAGV